MIICKRCKGTKIQIAYWANPNTEEIINWEPVFDYNEAPDNVQVQWCATCEDEVKVEEFEPLDAIKTINERCQIGLNSDAPSQREAALQDIQKLTHMFLLGEINNEY